MLTEQNITLKPLAAEHQSFYVALANHPDIRERVNNIFPYDQAHFETLLSSTADESRFFAWIIEESGTARGVIQFKSLRSHPQIFQGGYWLAPEAWGHGIASTALKLVTEYLFTECKAERVQAMVEPDNPASKHVLEKNGYHCEGLLRSFYPSRRRGLRDVFMYARIATH